MTTAIVLDPMMGRKNEKETVELDDGGFFIVIS
jgi:hypothetical protein